MNIEVKGINGRLIMKVQENCSFDQFLEDLDQLLDQPLFIQEGYYPRAFFDFGCHWNYRFKNDQRTLSLLEKISNFTSFFTAFWVE